MSDIAMDVQTNELPSPDVSDEDVALDILSENEQATDNEVPVEDTPRFKVKINGLEKEVTQDELVTGYQKVTAADEKFQQAASHLKQAEEKVAEAERVRGMYESRLQQYVPGQEALLQQLQEEAAYYHSIGDSDGLAKKQYEIGVELNRYNAARNEMANMQQQRQMQEQQLAQQRLETSQKMLAEAIPEWKDEAVKKAEGEKIVEWFKSNGLTNEDLSAIDRGVYGYMPILMARKAMLFDAMMQKVATRKAGQSEMTNAPPPVTRIGTSSSGMKDPSKMSDSEWIKWRDKQVRSKAS